MRQKNKASGDMDEDQAEKDQRQVNIFKIDTVFFMGILSPGKNSGDKKKSQEKQCMDGRINEKSRGFIY